MTIYIFRDSEISKSIPKLVNKLEQKTRALWAASCSEHVLHFYEEINPDEIRPQKAIKAARAWAMSKMTAVEAREAELNSNAAAREADTVPGMMLAKAAEHAAAIAHAKGHAVPSATYAAKFVFHSAEAGNNDNALQTERAWQLKLLKDIRDNVG